MKKVKSSLVGGVLTGILIILSMILFATLASADYSWSGNDVTYNTSEEVTYHHNMSVNVSGTGANRAFSIDVDNSGGNTPITWNNITINYSLISNWIYVADSVGGDLVINASKNNETGFFGLPLRVSWTGGAVTSTFYFNVTPINDAPTLVGMQNFSLNATQLFYQLITTSDEENEYPFKLNATFVSCSLVGWSTRDCGTASGKALFNTSNTSQYNFNNVTGQLTLNFTPSRNDVGMYTINFTIEDTANLSASYTDTSNKSTSYVVNFTVLDMNTAPQFVSICESSPGYVYKNTTEDQTFTCYINVSDLGENNSMTFNFTAISSFSSDLRWFSNITINNSIANYNASILISTTPTVRNVGNWTINVSVKDAGTTYNNGIHGNLTNYTTLTFFVNFVNHSVLLESISNISLSNSSGASTSITYVNASDEDILIPDKTVYNESLTFNITLNGTVRSWANITTYSIISGTNITTAQIYIDPRGQTGGNYTANVSVYDSNRNSTSYQTFNVELKSNDAPVWTAPAQVNLTYSENQNIYLNLSQNVSDANGDAITFSYSNDTIFPSFNLNSSTGIINFTTGELDVGQHLVTITAADPLHENSSIIINFSISNVNDAPYIESLPGASLGGNATYNATSNVISIYESQRGNVTIFVQDNDSVILQKSFYNESLNLSLSCVPNCPSWFNFSNTGTLGNRTNFTARFTPPKNNTTYNITVTITDNSSSTVTLNFNLTLFAINNPPVLGSIPDSFKKTINETFYYDFNATDEEDGVDSSGNFTYNITNLTVGGNFLINYLNTTTGIVNMTNLTNISGVWKFNLSITDTGGKINSDQFWLYVYSYPNISYPLLSQQFSFAENTTASFTFSINDTVGYWWDKITGGQINDFYVNYSIYVNDILRNSSRGYGDGTNITVSIPLSFTNHTCSSQETIKLNATNELGISNVSTWNLTINNTEYSLEQLQNFSDVDTTGTSATINLSSYYRDYDASDSCYNQTIGFVYNLISGSGQTVSITNWTGTTSPSISFSSGSETIASYSITAFEYNISNSSQSIKNITSNNFIIHLNPSTVVTTTTTPSTGGGTSGTVTKIVFLKIIVPEPITARNKDTIVIPLKINNPSQSPLTGVTLTASVSKGGVPRNDFSVVFTRDKFDSIAAGNTELTELTLKIDNAENGDYEVNIAANVTNPKYSDWAKVYLTVNEGKAIFERIVFTEKLIVDNPECLELKELVDEARRQYDLGNYDSAQQQIDEAIESCKKSIEQRGSSLLPKKYLNMSTIYYVIIASILAFVIGVIIYYYQRSKIENMGSQKV